MLKKIEKKSGMRYNALLNEADGVIKAQIIRG